MFKKNDAMSAGTTAYDASMLTFRVTHDYSVVPGTPSMDELLALCDEYGPPQWWLDGEEEDLFKAP